jgi:hypothetical protein
LYEIVQNGKPFRMQIMFINQYKCRIGTIKLKFWSQQWQKKHASLGEAKKIIFQKKKYFKSMKHKHRHQIQYWQIKNWMYSHVLVTYVGHQTSLQFKRLATSWRNQYYKRRYIPQISSNSNTNLSEINSAMRVWLYNLRNICKVTIIVTLINNNFLFANFFSLKSTDSRSSRSWNRLILDSQKWLFEECHKVQNKKPIIIKSNKNTRKIKKNWRILHFD